MRTIIQIEDREGSGRTVSLPSSSATPSTTDSTEEDQDEVNQSFHMMHMLNSFWRIAEDKQIWSNL